MGARLGWLAAALLTASCTGSSVALQSPPPANGSTGSYGSPPASPAATISPIGSPAPNAPRCRLPVVSWDQAFLSRQAGFIDTATGTFSPDPSGVMVSDDSTGLYHTPDQPYLYGQGGSSYDLARHRWLPVPRDYVSPDGDTYAYAVRQPGPLPGVHIVDVATLSDRVVAGTGGDPDPRGYHYYVVGYQTDGVYLTRVNQLGGGGLWRLDPATGALTQVSTDAPGIGVVVVGSQAWWNTPHGSSTPEDPFIYHQYLTGAPGQHAETWFERPGLRVNVIGAASGKAIVVAESAATIELWLLTTPNSATQIYGAAGDRTVGTLPPFDTAVAEPGGWWIGSESGLFFTSNDAFGQVSTKPVRVAGECA